MVNISQLRFQSPGEFNTWHERELFTGNEEGPYVVPNIGDIIYTDNHGIKRVSDVDLSTGLSVWVSYYENGLEVSKPEDAITNPDGIVLFNSGLGNPSEDARCYIDTSVWPYTMSIDAGVVCWSPRVTYYRVFRGVDTTTNTGVVVSEMRNTNDTILNDCIPMERNDVGGYSTCGLGFCNTKLRDNEIVTVIFYSSEDRIEKMFWLLVRNTDVVRRLGIASTRIIDIRLLGPFIRDGAPYDIEVPQGTSVATLGIRCQVSYSDGRKLILPIDGDKVRLNGQDAFITNIPGQFHRLSLAYRLDESEVNDTSHYLTETGIVTIPHRAVIRSISDLYTTKIFAIPEYISAVEGYRLLSYVHNLSYEFSHSVTSLVSITGFDPLLYDVQQEVVFRLNLSDISVAYRNQEYIYMVYITLKDPLLDPTQSSVAYELGQDPELKAPIPVTTSQNGASQWEYDLSLGFGGVDAWINSMYRPAKILYDTLHLNEPPMPNRFRTILNGVTYDHPIEDLMTTFTIPFGIKHNGVVPLELYRLLGGTEMKLGTIGLPVVRN